MNANEFRLLFNKDRDMPVKLLDGSPTLALGLNGENVILFKPGGHIELDLAWFVPDAMARGIVQVAEAGDVTQEQIDFALTKVTDHHATHSRH